MKLKGRQLLCILAAMLLTFSLILTGCNGGEGDTTAPTTGGKGTVAKPIPLPEETEKEFCEHDYVAGSPVEPTCTSDGYTRYTCSKCKDSYRGDLKQALGHAYKFDNGTFTKPTASELGYCEYTCSKCQNKEQYGKLDYTTFTNKLEYENVDGGVYVVGFKTGVSDTKVIVPPVNNQNKKVLGIKEGAFKNNTTLEEVYLPDSLLEIGKEAFKGCVALETVEVGRAASLVTIGDAAFSGCELLGEFAVPASTVTIGVQAFSGCKLLEATFSAYGKLETVGMYAFQGSATEELYFPATVKMIDSYAFADNKSLTTLVFAEESSALTEIAPFAFQNCEALESLVIPSCVKKIGKEAFHNCPSLVRLSFAEDTALESVGQEAFYNNNIEVLSLPATLTKLGDGAFFYSRSLVKLYIPNSLESISNRAFGYSDNLSEIIFTGDGASALKSIGSEAFYRATSLAAFVLPAGVTEIGSGAFKSCTALKTFTVEEGSVLTTVGAEAFFGCSALKGFAVPASVTAIGDYAFFQSGIASVTFGGTASSDALTIGEFAFNGCKSLKELNLPANLAEVGDYAFGACESLETVAFANGSAALTVGRVAFGRCESLVRVTLPDNLAELNETAFHRSEGAEIVFNGNLEDVTVSDGEKPAVDSIEDSDGDSTADASAE